MPHEASAAVCKGEVRSFAATQLSTLHISKITVAYIHVLITAELNMNVAYTLANDSLPFTPCDRAVIASKI